MNRIVGIVASLVALIAVPALADPAVPAAQAPQSNAAAPPPQSKTPAQIAYENEIVCQKEEVTGSRLGSRRVCLTRGEWMRARMDDKAWVEAIQHRGDASSK